MKKHLILYICLTFLLLLNLILDIVEGISLNGYWSDRVLFWIWLLFTLLLIFNYWHKRGIKFYAWSLGILLLLSMLPMFMPFATIILTGFGLDRSFGKSFDDNIRIQVVGKGFMGRPNVEVIERRGIYEKMIGEMSGFELYDGERDLNEIKALKILREDENNLLVEFQLKSENVRYILDRK